jgi:hypothetical protein
MSSARLEEIAREYRQEADEATDPRDRRYYESYYNEYMKILKERAEAGTYDDDHTDRSGSATARQGRASW